MSLELISARCVHWDKYVLEKGCCLANNVHVASAVMHKASSTLKDSVSKITCVKREYQPLLLKRAVL